MNVRLRQVACVPGLREETEVGEFERTHHHGPTVDQRQVRHPSKMCIDKENNRLIAKKMRTISDFLKARKSTRQRVLSEVLSRIQTL